MGTRPGQSSMVHPAPSAISLAWPIRPKPVTSVQALGRRGTAARAASRLSAAIRSVIARYSAPLSSSALAAVVRIPVPRGLVSTSRSPSLAPRLVSTAPGWTRPLTHRPYLGSASSMLWPPAVTAPASATLAAPPSRMAPTASRGRQEGTASRFMASLGSPPMAYTSERALAAAICPKS